MNPRWNDVLYLDKGKPREKPILDEQRLTELDEALQDALDTGFPVRVKVFGPYEERTYVGVIRGVAARCLVLEGTPGMIRIPFADVLDIQSTE